MLRGRHHRDGDHGSSIVLVIFEGLEFTPENGGGAGIRFRERKRS